MWYREFYPKSKPRSVAGGIKSQSRKGAFGTSWWAKQWIAVLESFNIGARLGRGRSYARRGQVTAIQIEPGTVTAKVQGSRATPYSVSIQIPPLSDQDWDKLIGELNSQAAFAAKLLAGEMPQDIETAFAKVGLSLFPKSLREIQTSCSCPDWSNPCKHIAAVYYLIGEEFDRDPFLLFRLRGSDRRQVCDRLTTVAQPTETFTETTESVVVSEPIPSDPVQFWASGTLPPNIYGDARVPQIEAAVLKRLGGFPFWQGAKPFLETLTPTYTGASQRGLQAFEKETTVPEQRITRKRT